MSDFGMKAKKLALAGLASAALIGGAMTASTAPAEAGARTGTWLYGSPNVAWSQYPGYNRRYYRPRRSNGGAVAAGVVGGLALGALAAGAATAAPAPVYGYPAYGYAAPVYGGDCYWTTRERVNRWGEVVVRRVQVCD